MSAIDNTPENKNFLSPLNFKFSIKKAPHVNFFIQKVNIPEIKLGVTDYPTPFVKVPVPGEHIEYGLLNVTFKVDEDLQNYLEIYNWLVGLGKPEDFIQYRNLKDKPNMSDEGIYSDISVMVLSSTKMMNYDIVYVDAFPISLSSVGFNTIDSDVNYIEASASFKYSYFNVNKT
jgi:hypothetical protein